MNYVTGKTIRGLRERSGITQKQLSEKLNVSDKTVSKWETGRGLPDIGVLTELAAALNVSVAELLTGEYMENSNRSSNMRKAVFYVCPLCGNVIMAAGAGSYSCCGILLPRLEPEDDDAGHGEIVKLYPEQNGECRFARRGHGYLYGYCSRHGLFSRRL